jgi:hypothetical protein
MLASRDDRILDTKTWMRTSYAINDLLSKYDKLTLIRLILMIELLDFPYGAKVGEMVSRLELDAEVISGGLERTVSSTPWMAVERVGVSEGKVMKVFYLTEEGKIFLRGVKKQLHKSYRKYKKLATYERANLWRNRDVPADPISKQDREPGTSTKTAVLPQGGDA